MSIDLTVDDQTWLTSWTDYIAWSRARNRQVYAVQDESLISIKALIGMGR